MTSAQIALVPLMWEPDAPAVRWAGELEAYKNPYVVREEDRAIQAASEWVLIAATIVFEPGNAAGVASIARGGLAQLRRLRGAVLRRVGNEADDAVEPAVRLAHRVDLSAGGESIDDGVRSVDQPLANTAAEGEARGWIRLLSFRRRGKHKGQSRADHVRLHNVDNPGKAEHGVFFGDAVDVINEAWARGQALGLKPNAQGVLTVPMGRQVGSLEAKPGLRPSCLSTR
ncbi:MAG: hypothetical protein IPK74_22015 [Deltaproteobacteria bacterium]|nr:hypothetical protein [Deltaproteobacteria bacterium]